MPSLPHGPDLTPKHLWNPLATDFTVMRADDNNIQHPYTVRAQEIATFPAYIRDHIARHLAQKIVLERGIKTNYEDEYNAMYKEITELEL